MLVDVLAGLVACGLLVLRRRPVAAAAVVLLSTVSTLAAGAGVLAAVRFAATQPLRRVAALGSVFVVAAAAWSRLLAYGVGLPLWGELVAPAGFYAVLVLVGCYLRSRRQLLETLREQAPVGTA